MSRRTNAVYGKPSRAPLVELMLTYASGATKVLTDKCDIEQAAIHELSHHPQQSVGTDLMQPSMLQDLDYLGTGAGAQAILDGMYVHLWTPPDGCTNGPCKTGQYTTPHQSPPGSPLRTTLPGGNGQRNVRPRGRLASCQPTSRPAQKTLSWLT